MRYVEAHGKRRWGEKTPLHIWHWDAMARVFPDAVFVAIVRHPGGSMASNMNRWKFSRQPRRDALRALHARDAAHGGQVPPPHGAAALRGAAAPARAGAARAARVAGRGLVGRRARAPSRAGRPRRQEVVEGRNRVSDPLDVSRISKWTSTIGEGQQRRLDKRFGRLAEFLGYSHDRPGGARADQRPRRAAHQRRRDPQRASTTFADLELRTRGPVPRFEHYYHPRDVHAGAAGGGARRCAPPATQGLTPQVAAVRASC